MPRFTFRFLRLRPRCPAERTIPTASLTPRERHWRDFLIRAYRALPDPSRPQ